MLSPFPTTVLFKSIAGSLSLMLNSAILTPTSIIDHPSELSLPLPLKSTISISFVSE